MATQLEAPAYSRDRIGAMEAIDDWLSEHPEALPPPVDRWDVGRREIYNEDTWQAVFADMRAQAPVNKVVGSISGDYWNVCTHDLIQRVESLPELFSSSYENGGITIMEPPAGVAHNYQLPMFIAMDRPDHPVRRRTSAPAFPPAEIVRLSEEIRKRTGEVLDALPIGEQFDWVQRVSVDLTTGMLAALLDFPREDQGLLTYWSDWITSIEAGTIPEVALARAEAGREMSDYLSRLWRERSKDPTGRDLLSIMIRSDSMGAMDQREFMGTMMLLITGGNDTTRNTMSGMVHALDQFPEQRELLAANPSLVANAMQEVIRYVSPVVHMRRTALRDTELGGQKIKAGDKVVMWYLSGNHDEQVFDEPGRLMLDRPNARRHLAFGYGIHRCVGARLAELQLRVLIEEMLARRMLVKVTGQVRRGGGAFMHAFRKLEVEVSRR